MLLHETVVDRVRPGMPARVRPESSPQRILMGRVLSVSPLPASDPRSRTGDEVKYYVGRIGLDPVPEGVRPGMTAEVSVMTAQQPGVTVSPAPSMACQGEQEARDVARREGVERRLSTADRFGPEPPQAAPGLREGDKVVLDPSRSKRHPPEDLPTAMELCLPVATP